MSSNSNTPSILNEDENQADNSNAPVSAQKSKNNEFILKNQKMGPNSAYSISQKIRVCLKGTFIMSVNYIFLL